jgi:acyl carrier protein
MTDLPDLAQRLREDRNIRDAAVLAGPEPGVLTAFVVSQGYRPGPVLRQRAMAVAGDLAGRLQVAVVREIPRDREGRLDRDQALAATRRPGVLHRFEAPATDVEHTLVELIADVLPEAQISMTDGLAPLGADSLTAVELLALIDGRFGVPVEPQVLYSAETIRDLAAVIAQALAAAPVGGRAP